MHARNFPRRPLALSLTLTAGLSSLLLTHSALAEDRERSPLAPAPAWETLRAYDGVVDRTRFLTELQEVYSLGDAYRFTLDVLDDAVCIDTDPGETLTLRFRSTDSSVSAEAPSRFWRGRDALRRDDRDPSRPLEGLHIALDPGHLGGKWARMEERWFRVDDRDRPVTEGDMTLAVSRLLTSELRALGARVSPVRTSARPITRLRPAHFEDLARQDLLRMGVADPEERYQPGWPPEERDRTVQWHREKAFYRVSEIRSRGEKVNGDLRPDVVLCLHFNAEAWGDPAAPVLAEENHLHVLINGAYSVYELGLADQRFEMLLRLFQGMHAEERALAEAVATAMARETQLPAYVYTTDNVKRPSPNPYVYARNLLANRLFACPVIYLEPYVMNNQDVYRRIQADPAKGTQTRDGRSRRSLYREYVDGVLRGLLDYYAAPPAAPDGGDHGGS